MRKRRVGVTARSGQIVESQETGSLQVETEMAAPLELRTPTGTCGEGRNQSADGSMATKAQETTGRMQSEKSAQGKREGKIRRGSGALGAHEALPQTPPGGKPPETPAPFPSESRFQNGGKLSRVRRPRNNGAPLTVPLRSEESAEMRERGPSATGGSIPRSPGADSALRAHEALPHTPLGASPLSPPTPPPIFSLTSGGLLMEAPTVREGCPRTKAAAATVC
jgi:hypothetical protein